MKLPVILAHGTLGEFDELLFLAVAIAFISIMAISWLRTRNLPPPTDAILPTSTDTAPTDNRETPDTFKLN